MFLILDTNLWAARSCAPNSMPDGPVLKLVGTNKFKEINVIKKKQNHYNPHVSPKNGIKRNHFSVKVGWAKS